MLIYEHRTTLTVAGGSAVSVTLDIVGGICYNLLIRSTGDSTFFRAEVEDSSSIVFQRYGWHEKEIVDNDANLAMSGRNTIRITNASLADVFNVVAKIRE